MKFLTILRDSLREAVDGKIFQAMIVVSGLFILFIASISYKPMTMKDSFDNEFSLLNSFMSNNPGVGQPTFSIENYRITNGATVPWEADYELDLVVTCPSKEAFDLAKKSKLPGTDAESVRHKMKEQYYYLSNVAVEEVPTGNPAQARMRITTHGTTVAEAAGWLHEPTILFGVRVPFYSRTLRTLVYRVENSLVNFAGGIALLLIGVVVTAGFVPNLLRKGTLDLYIVKPIGRSELLVYKYVGGLIFVFVLTSVTVLGVWLVIGLRTGMWSLEFLLVIPILTLYFAILYAVSVFIGVLTRNALVAILASLFAWGLLMLVGTLNDEIKKVRHQEAKIRQVLAANDSSDDSGRSALGLPRWVETGLHVLSRALPRGWDLDTQAARGIARGVLTEQEVKKDGLDEPLPPWGETVGVSVVWIGILLGLACWRFETRDG
ncbi:MAG: ABC transporter permease [Planctomycetes bacterium]|nr:ABC transporter permease [Planctomycetota bacterium]